MADTKITSLQPPQAGYSVVPATDVLPIVVIADPGMATSGSTRKVTVNQLLGAGGTATLASATITGDLTVGTGAFGAGQSGGLIGNGKQVVFTNNSGSNSGWISNADNACIYSSGAGGAFAFNGHLVLQPRGSAAGAILFGTGNGAAAMAERYKIDSTGISTWSVAGTTAMTLNSTGLGVGASPAHKLQAVGGYVASGKLASASTGDIGGLLMYCSTDNGGRRSWGLKAESGTTGVLGFWLSSANNTEPFSGTQVMSLDASGNLLVGTTSALASGSTIQNLGASRQVLTLKGDAFGSYTAGIWNASTTNDGLFVYFGTEASLTVRGGISYNRGGGLVAYNTTSDYRAKDIIGPVSNSGSLIDSLKVYVGKMKGATIERPMLIAHEAQEVAPYAVTGTKDEVDAEGKPKYQQMDASALVPLLIAEIQSLRARVQTLEAK